MSRVQLALNVDDVDAAVAFYTTLFAQGPAKRRPGYANFAIDDPPVKLVLIENPGRGGTLNHLGVEVASTDEVLAQTERLAAEGLTTTVEDATTCCYALQDKVWVDGPPGHRWEVYTVLADASPELEGATTLDLVPGPSAGGCCTGSADAQPLAPCCAD